MTKRLQELYDEFQKTHKFHDVSPNFVPGEGSLQAGLFLIGEAPGKNEDKERRPFVGDAGKKLEELLKSIRLDRKQVFITNLFKYRPPRNRAPLPHEIKASLNLLTDEIKLIRPKIIVPMGKYATSVFVPLERFSAVRGHVIKRGNRLIIPTFHPATTIWDDTGKAEQELKVHFKKIGEVLQHGFRINMDG